MGDDQLALDDTLRLHLNTLGPQLRTLELSPNSTIVPLEAEDTAGQRAMNALLPARTLHNDIELKGTIGEGGMGIVRNGTQRSLGRAVAIKTLRPEHREPRDVLALLREAWVTGTLEHPNILPIHDVKLDEAGMPLVVLKRIDGQDWGEMMHNPTQLTERFGEGEALDHNLTVLMQVCHAIAFAHSRGIVHRDIKPDNVRIGAFGEVYVLDWGIAVALEDDGTGRFPLAGSAAAMAGTPNYMAPEMLGGDEDNPITVRTDIYLLGATLYEIATGRPPHDGSTAVALVSSVLKSSPNLDGVPHKLGAIVQRCMNPDPRARFQSADEVRTAIRRFLEQRGSDQLAAIANAKLEELVLAAKDADGVMRVAVHDLLGACRAGFSAALDMWNDNRDAQRGLHKAVATVVDYELRRGDARAAAALIAQLNEPPPLLDKRVRRGLEKQRQAEERHDELEALGKDLDPKTGTRTRMVVGVIIGTSWSLLPLLSPLGFADESYRAELGLTVAGLAACLVLFTWARDSLTKTAYNRRLAAIVLFTLMSTFALIAGAWLRGIPPAQLSPIYLFLWGVVAGLTAITIERRIWPSAVSYTLAFLAATLWPEERFYLMSASNAVITLNFAIAWRPGRAAPPSSHAADP